MQLVKDGVVIDFLGKRFYAGIFSAILLVGGLVSVLMHQGLNYGIDFRGGTNIQIRFKEVPNLDQLRDFFADKDLGNVMLQTFGSVEDREILLGLSVDNPLGTGEKLTYGLRQMLQTDYPELELRRIETIGPKVGDELKTSALQAIMIALGLVLVYITFRFQWRQGIAAIITLLHDVMVVVGIFSIFDKEFTLPVIAALLTVVGYSLNDTIVIFDRIRENISKFRQRKLLPLINQSVTETLSRTLLTSGTTLLVVLALFFLGGEIIHDFAFALLIGVLIGTYSSIYVASPVVLWLTKIAPPKSSD
ncbi:MAG: protein translocase subunit SecF [SAR324 cluster bacterium]|jgi:preprotein translocase subunit SecF|nr:protein translocase subunit SecF [Deltaproteobacteria bacterium]MDP6091768.1 protein translocase subunit SecF [SAR324 cluster bacterium]MBI12320.1 protein translocase subunit SecF [Deltaproteobacteria bacterium]MDP6463542.1 protein translocase subunit SecF [SAR324 cluster bacterium]MDP7332563.1 protein translocase subunit SecF [SAR324 cluster bacterium]|tara:strand:+ start:41 stop:955 length:915 start_codon:yes stop_codon:yes gene_type:complete